MAWGGALRGAPVAGAVWGEAELALGLWHCPLLPWEAGADGSLTAITRRMFWHGLKIGRAHV